ncbi:hypothetical protein F2Q69_00015404 [Brassica cretica]|uniref:Uncharacterized protein n=1 Tax=Brassica cretica TaxID=69181 RepID=A0A8S9QWN3_BRACR|nr:hypothetical protein F2Q69_00015404 [Brassica cretica]
MASRSAPSVVDFTGVSAGKPWELVLVVARWIMQLGTVRSGSRVGDRVRVVAVPFTVTARKRDSAEEGKPPMASRSAPSVLDVTGVSAGKPWELVLVVARWIMQLGTV